jgi:hypothetical protein
MQRVVQSKGENAPVGLLGNTPAIKAHVQKKLVRAKRDASKVKNTS